jgi:hypothetical protein
MIGLVQKSLQIGGIPAKYFPYALEHSPWWESHIRPVDAMSRR